MLGVVTRILAGQEALLSWNRRQLTRSERWIQAKRAGALLRSGSLRESAEAVDEAKLLDGAAAGSQQCRARHDHRERLGA